MSRGLLMASLGGLGVVLLAAASVCFMSGCSTIGYYAQSVGGHLSLLRAAKPVPEWLGDEATPQSGCLILHMPRRRGWHQPGSTPMTMKLITAAALTLALAVPALAQDSKATTGGATPAPAVKVEAPKATTPAAAPAATKPAEAPKAVEAPKAGSGSGAMTPAPAAATKPADAPKAVEAPKATTPAVTPAAAPATPATTAPAAVKAPEVKAPEAKK